ncbi:MAG: DUF1428 domain-containing protein [Gammaproteobacteria bacterium]|nr:DUF1428 domain-containing protein [Gammaproteobacteria bacterium]
MTYYTGAVSAVPTARRQDYIDYARAVWEVFQRYGATRMVETWGVDVPHGKLTDFHRAVEAAEDESIAFSWITWPDRDSADAAWRKMQEDGAMDALPKMPYDGSRMIFGGFAPVVEEGGTAAGRYYQGFALAVPEANKAAYVDAARKAWTLFDRTGALGLVEAWGDDVPRGKRTDFYRAAAAIEGEVPVFSWIAWPDRATCQAAEEAMRADGEMEIEMPFDGKRMVWGGFEPVFDSGA